MDTITLPPTKGVNPRVVDQLVTRTTAPKSLMVRAGLHLLTKMTDKELQALLIAQRERDKLQDNI